MVEVDELDFGSLGIRERAAMSERMTCEARANGMALTCASSVGAVGAGIYISLETVAQKSESSEHQTTCRSDHAAVSPAGTLVYFRDLSSTLTRTSPRVIRICASGRLLDIQPAITQRTERSTLAQNSRDASRRGGKAVPVLECLGTSSTSTASTAIDASSAASCLRRGKA